jgi:hypothetical protein
MAIVYGLLDTLGLVDKSSPKNVAMAYQRMNRDMLQETADDKDATQYNTLQNAKQSGESPADVYANDQSLGYKEPTDLDRWQQQIDGLINSENPVLQAEGIKFLGDYNQRVNTPKTQLTDNRSPGAKYADELGLAGKVRTDFIRSYAMKAGTRVLIDQADKYIPPNTPMTDANGTPIAQPAGLTYQAANDLGYLFAQQPTAQEAKQAADIQISNMNIDRLAELVQNPELDFDGFSGYLSKFRGGSNLTNIAVDNFMNKFGNTMPSETSEALALTLGLSVEIISAIRGAQVGPKEELMFQKQLPTFGQPREIFLINMQRQKRNLTLAKIIAKEGRGAFNNPIYKNLTEQMERENLETWGTGGWEAHNAKLGGNSAAKVATKNGPTAGTTWVDK